MANLDKDKSLENDAYSEEVSDSTVDTDIDSDVDDGDEFSWTASDDEDELETDDESEVESETEQDEEAEAQPQQRLSKEARKIRALKNEAKRLQKENAELQQRVEAKSDADATAELQKKYEAAGYDEDEARSRAKDEVRQNRLEQRLEQLEFKDNNYSVFQKYPKAVADMSKVMKAVKASGMTAEQVCRGLYGEPAPETERRAREAVLGNTETNGTGDRVASATRSAKPVPKTSLTDSEIRAKRQIEKMYNGGKPMSDADFIAAYRK